METYEEKIIRYADTMAECSDYNGRMDKDCYDPTKSFSYNRTDMPFPIQKIRKELQKHLPLDGNFDNFNKFIQKLFDDTRNHLLNNGYIDKPTAPNLDWILNDEGKLMKRLGGHAKYQEYKKQELDLKWYQTENAKIQYNDYPRLKRRARNAFILSIISVLIAALGVLIKWKCQ